MIELLSMSATYFSAPILSFLLTSIGAIVAYLLRPRVKLIWGMKNKFTHIVHPKKEGEEPITIHTAHYVIQNLGRMPARNVEVVLNYSPDEISIWNQRNYRIEQNKEGRQLVIIDFLAAREFIDFVLLNIATELPDVLNVKCPDYIGKQVNILYFRQFPKIVYLALWALLFLGFVFLIEQLIRFLVGA